MSYQIALSHAGSPAAEAILELLPESGLSPDSLVLLDTADRVGNRIAFAGQHRALQDQDNFDLTECQVLLMPEVDPDLQQRALEQGCLLVSHAIDTDTESLAVGPGLPEPVISYSAVQLRLADAELSCLLPVLHALSDLATIERLGVVSLRSAEFRGSAGIEELASQTIALLNSREASPVVYPRQIAFNAIPESLPTRQIADFQQHLGNSSCSIDLQTVNVPLFHGFAAALQLAFSEPVDEKRAKELLGSMDDVSVSDSVVTPITDCHESFACAISHVQQVPEQPSNLQFWLVTDPMRYGLAKNYVNVLDFLLKSFL